MDEIASRRSNVFKIVVIILLVLVLVLLSFIGYFTVSEAAQLPTFNIFSNANDENTILLEEFLVNLNVEGNQRNYIKTKIALMYTDKDGDEIINSNMLKIRDTIINDLRRMTSEDILNGENTSGLKISLIESINAVLDKNIIKEIYFSDLIIQ